MGFKKVSDLRESKSRMFAVLLSAHFLKQFKHWFLYPRIVSGYSGYTFPCRDSISVCFPRDS